MKESQDYKDWYEFATRVYSKNALDIYANKISVKDYELNTEEARRFATAFANPSETFKSYPINECYILQVHLHGIAMADRRYQFYYYLWAKDDHKKESYRYSDLMDASFYAESFFLRWYNYFEKLSHVMNWAIGFEFDTRKSINHYDTCSLKGIFRYLSGNRRKTVNRTCSFINVCRHLRRKPTTTNPLLSSLSRIHRRGIYKQISGIRHDLTHRFLNFTSLAGSSMYGAIAKHEDKKYSGVLPINFDKINERLAESPLIIQGIPVKRIKPSKKVSKTVTHTMGPKEGDKPEDRVYSPEEIYDLIDKGTDTLAEIKREVFEFTDNL
jgi:hypothetical protein